jgi:hypothetical protein
MMKKILTFTTFTTFAMLAGGVMAGGDDRDFGPVETLDFVQTTEPTEIMPTPVAEPETGFFTDFLSEIGLESAPVVAPTPPAAPVVEKAVIIEKAPETMTFTKIDTSVSVPEPARQSCQSAFNLSDGNVNKFEEALKGGFLFSTGPVNTAGTLFSPQRWANYLSCVENN